MSFLALLVSCYGVPRALVWYLIGFFAVVGLILLGYNYQRMYKSIAPYYAAASSMEQAYLLSEVVVPAPTLMAYSLDDILAHAASTMNEQVEEVLRAQASYRDYIETWVHEAKTPLTTCDVLLHNNPGELADALAPQLRKLNDYVEQALYFARSTSVHKDFMVRRIVLGDVVRDVVRSSAQDLIAAHVHPVLGELSYEVQADSKWLSFILRQILLNSAKYQRKDAPSDMRTIEIYACVEQTGAETYQIVLSVRDHGIGIPAAELPRVFERGFTGSNGREEHSKATGMGLYLADQLCEKMSLGLEVRSREGEGTELRIVFPVSHLSDVLRDTLDTAQNEEGYI